MNNNFFTLKNTLAKSSDDFKSADYTQNINLFYLFVFKTNSGFAVGM